MKKPTRTKPTTAELLKKALLRISKLERRVKELEREVKRLDIDEVTEVIPRSHRGVIDLSK